MKTASLPFGEEYLGLNMRSTVKTESRYTDFRSIVERARLFNYNPMNMLRFSWAAVALSERETPSFRMHEYRLSMDVASSATKEIEASIKWGVATKKMGESARYHVVKPKQSGEGRQWGDEEESDTKSLPLVPFKIVSKKLGEQSIHPRRQEKIQKVLHMT